MCSLPVCPVCGCSFVRTDAVIYLRAENILMHRSCCHLHPSCRCDEVVALCPVVPRRDVGEFPEVAAA